MFEKSMDVYIWLFCLVIYKTYILKKIICSSSLCCVQMNIASLWWSSATSFVFINGDLIRNRRGVNIYVSTQFQALWCCNPPSPRKTIYLLDKLNEWMNIPITATLLLIRPKRAVHMLCSVLVYVVFKAFQMNWGTAQRNQ